jgi:hypothetical protein
MVRRRVVHRGSRPDVVLARRRPPSQPQQGRKLFTSADLATQMAGKVA